MIVVEQRIPRTALAIVAGVAGALMQGLTPNPLADLACSASATERASP